MARRIRAAVLAVVATLLLTSCQLLDPIFESPREFPNDIDHLANSRVETIVDLAIAQDADGLKQLFSSEALAQSVDLDAAIGQLFGIFADEIDWYSLNNDNPAEFKYSESDGDYWKVFTPVCVSFVDGDEYQLYILDYYENTVEPGLVGLYSVRAEFKPFGCTHNNETGEHEVDEVESNTSNPGGEAPGVVVHDGSTS